MKDKKLIKFSVRCYAGDGSMIGSVLEDNFGNPLTRRMAKSIERFENERSEKRKAQGLSGAFQYALHAWDAATLAAVN